MKTLDEVIKANECCDHGEPDSNCDECPYGALGACCAERESDAIHYLKMYRSDKAQWEIDREQWETAGKDAREAYEKARDKHISRLKELEIGLINNPLTWDELFCLEMIGRPVWSEEKRAWFLIADSALDNRSWVDLVDSSGKIIRIGPHDLEKYQLYKREKK